MSINEMDSKIKELRRMADELAAEIDSITDSIKAHMDAEGVETISGTDWKVTYKAVTSSRIDTSALKKALPDVVERFSKTTTAREKGPMSQPPSKRTRSHSQPPREAGNSLPPPAQKSKEEIYNARQETGEREAGGRAPHFGNER